MKKVILPYIEQVKDDLDLPLKQKSLCIFDVFRAQISDEIMDFLKEKSIIPVMVPANWTDKLQPMDLSIQKPAKDFIKKTISGMVHKFNIKPVLRFRHIY